jgi:hypothetical protein
LLGRRLLGTHEFRCTKHHAHGGITAGFREARDAEVGDHRTTGPTLEENVCRLDVAVHDALRVRVRERPGDFAHDPRDVVRRKRAVRGQALRQRSAVDVRHDDEHESADLVDGVNRHDVRMRQPRRGSRFAHETIAQLRSRRELGWQQLDGHRTVEQDLARQIDDAHTAPSELTLQRITSGDGLLKGYKEFVDSLLRHMASRMAYHNVLDISIANPGALAHF